MATKQLDTKVVLVTGAARRIGAEIAVFFHGKGYKTIIHFNSAVSEAEELRDQLNDCRPNSCLLVQGDLNHELGIRAIVDRVESCGRLDVLVNNASSFYPTPLETSSESQWEDLMNTNLKGPLYLSKLLASILTQNSGSIVNISDTHARQALKRHSIYSIAKAGNIAMTKSLALELAPAVRVNSVAPGAILWPEHESDDVDERTEVLNKIPLGRLGTTRDIAECVYFLAVTATYITGQTIAVDGGSGRAI